MLRSISARSSEAREKHAVTKRQEPRRRERDQLANSWRGARESEAPSSNRDSKVQGIDVEAGLQRFFQATGDPAFKDAIAAMRSYGLSEGSPVRTYRAVQTAIWGEPQRGYLENMRWFIDRMKFSIKRAAEHVTEYYHAPGHSYEAVAKTLRGSSLNGSWQVSLQKKSRIEDMGSPGSQSSRSFPRSARRVSSR